MGHVYILEAIHAGVWIALVNSNTAIGKHSQYVRLTQVLWRGRCPPLRMALDCTVLSKIIRRPPSFSSLAVVVNTSTQHQSKFTKLPLYIYTQSCQQHNVCFVLFLFLGMLQTFASQCQLSSLLACFPNK